MRLIDVRPRGSDAPPLYCPRCGIPFSIATWEWPGGRRSEAVYCAPGEMGLAPKLVEIFTARYVHREPQGSGPAFNWQVHGHLARWFCPGCGIQLDEQGECPRCHYHLRDVSHPLIELHGHRPIRSGSAG